MKIPFIGPSYVARSRNISFDECINFYPENSEQPTAKNVRSLIGTPGYTLLATPTALGEGRGMYSPAGIFSPALFFVAGNVLYRSLVDGTDLVTIGTLETSTGQVYFADSGSSQTSLLLFLVDGQYAYTVDMVDNTFTRLDTFPATEPTHCAFMDGRFIVNDAKSLTCYYSGSWNASSWSATDDFTFESTPDNCNGLITLKGQIWLFGKSSCEVFYNASSSTQLFQRISGTASQTGLAAKDSLASNGERIFWVGANNLGTSAIYMSEGYGARKISTYSIEYDMSQYNITDGVGYCYSDDGHDFYVLSFEEGNKTWVFDVSSNYWHRRTHFDNGNENRHRGLRGVNINEPSYGSNYALCQDWENGKVYKFDLETYTDNGGTIRRVRSCPAIHQDRKRLSFSSFQVDMETGVGLTSGQGSDPKAVVQLSNDSGHTWGDEIQVGLGKLGNYTYRVKINRLGQAYDRVFRYVCTEPIKQILIGGNIEAEIDG